MSPPAMRPISELNASAEQVGREIVAEVLLGYGDALAPADKETRSRLIGGLATCALLYAARACGLNKIWLLEGIGVAVGETQATQEPKMAAMVLEAFERGRDMGFGERVAPPGDPRRMRAALEAIAAGDGTGEGEVRVCRHIARRALGLEPQA